MTLDKEQLIASKYIDNHSLIIAGAGTGKTTTLLNKVEYLIKSGFKENEILVISFTNETVNNFKKKCPYNIDVFTFHKLANKITNSQCFIVDDTTLKDIIKNFLKCCSNKLKKKLVHIIYFRVYSDNFYNKQINSESSSSITSYLFSLIKHIKTNNISINRLNASFFSKKEQLLLYCAKSILDKYNNYLNLNDCMDFDDLIVEGTNTILKSQYISNYKHILVDEYQDISLIRLLFLQSLVKANNSILTAVGDDFQAIYGFSGSNIDLFYDFRNYFNNSKIFYITTTYRCPYKIVNTAGKFIMKNKMQITKNLKSVNKLNSTIKKVHSNNYKKDLSHILNKYKDTNKSVMILGRNNYDINFLIDKKTRLINSYLVMDNKKYNNIRYLTIHKSKGLEADIVIIINLSNEYNSLPNKRSNKLIKKLINSKDTYKYAEERRLFYVALTRAKNKVYLLVDENNPSQFIKEI